MGPMTFVTCSLFRRAVALRRRARAPIGSVMCRLRHDERGHALVEAALVFPLMISLFLGISEYGEALTVSRRVEAAAATGVDLVARLRTVSSADLTQIKPMLDEMIRPFPTASLGLVLTSVVADEENNTTVAWSYAEGAGVSQRAMGSAVTLPAGLTEPGKSIILGEVRYTFRSTLATLILGDVPMTAEAYVRPRLVSQIEKTD